MALRGSLLEFELPDIFQLIANDGKTGQLVVYNKDSEAFVIFSRGLVVLAGNGIINLQTVLFKYLIGIKHYTEPELNELLYLCQGEIRLFTQELVNKNYLTKEELTVVARMSIEDLACDLFLWENGHYRFDSLDNVDDYMVAGVTLSSDAVTMEAMRRIDEWKRMKSVITPDTIFIHTRPGDQAQQSSPVALSSADFAGCIFARIDGVSSVEALCAEAFFTEYRIHETLIDLWQNNKIVPLRSPRVVKKPLEPPKVQKTFPAIAPALTAYIIVHCAVLCIVGFGYLLNKVIVSKTVSVQQQVQKTLSSGHSEIKIRVAALSFHSLYGFIPLTTSQLKDSSSLSAHDLRNYSSLSAANHMNP